MLGPQWLCTCSESGGADTPEEVGADAAQHFLYHHDRGDVEAVSVYKERNDWLYTISTVEGATEAIKRWGGVTAKEGATTFSAPFPLPAGTSVEIADSSGASIYTVLSSMMSATGDMTHTVQKAEQAARSLGDAWKKPVDTTNSMDPLLPRMRPVRPMLGVDVGNMSFEEANATFARMVDEQRRLSLARWNTTYVR